MESSLIHNKKTKSNGKLLILVFTLLVIVSAFVLYFFLSPKPWITQKTKIIEVGSNVQICDLVNCTDAVGVSYHPKPSEPFSLGKLEITFSAYKGDKTKDFTFIYNVVDTTDPVIERINESDISVGQAFALSNYIKVTDNSSEELIGKVAFETISTDTLGDFAVELSVKDSSGNEAKYTFEYTVVDPTAIAPDLTGTKKVMQFINGRNRVTYVAEIGNPYGVTAGLYVGEFRKEVTFEGVEVGGVVLIPKVVEKLLADRDGKAIFIPADISEINNISLIKLSLETIFWETKQYDNHWLKIDTTGNMVSISNVVVGHEVANSISFSPGVFPEYIINGIFSTEISDDHLYDFTIFGNFDSKEYFQKTFYLGQKITETKNVFGLFLNYKNIELSSIKESEILKIGNSIVFLKDFNLE